VGSLVRHAAPNAKDRVRLNSMKRLMWIGVFESVALVRDVDTDEQRIIHAVVTLKVALHIANAQPSDCAASERRYRTMKMHFTNEVAVTCDLTVRTVSTLAVSLCKSGQQKWLTQSQSDTCNRQRPLRNNTYEDTRCFSAPFS